MHNPTQLSLPLTNGSALPTTHIRLLTLDHESFLQLHSFLSQDQQRCTGAIANEECFEQLPVLQAEKSNHCSHSLANSSHHLLLQKMCGKLWAGRLLGGGMSCLMLYVCLGIGVFLWDRWWCCFVCVCTWEREWETEMLCAFLCGEVSSPLLSPLPPAGRQVSQRLAEEAKKRERFEELKQHLEQEQEVVKCVLKPCMCLQEIQDSKHVTRDVIDEKRLQEN